MNTIRAYDEVIDFIAGAINPRNLIAFQPSEKAKQRVIDLIERERSGILTSEEKSELDHYMQLEHLMRLAKARARHYLTHE